VEEQERATPESTAAKRRANRRLSCCLKMNDAPDGIVVHLPARQ
jgi:ferredoxin